MFGTLKAALSSSDRYEARVALRGLEGLDPEGREFARRVVARLGGRLEGTEALMCGRDRDSLRARAEALRRGVARALDDAGYASPVLA